MEICTLNIPNIPYVTKPLFKCYKGCQNIIAVSLPEAPFSKILTIVKKILALALFILTGLLLLPIAVIGCCCKNNANGNERVVVRKSSSVESIPKDPSAITTYHEHVKKLPKETMEALLVNLTPTKTAYVALGVMLVMESGSKVGMQGNAAIAKITVHPDGRRQCQMLTESSTKKTGADSVATSLLLSKDESNEQLITTIVENGFSTLRQSSHHYAFGLLLPDHKGYTLHSKEIKRSIALNVLNRVTDASSLNNSRISQGIVFDNLSKFLALTAFTCLTPHLAHLRASAT